MHHACGSHFGLGGRWGKIEENKTKISSVVFLLSSLRLPNVPSMHEAREAVLHVQGSSVLGTEAK